MLNRSIKKAELPKVHPSESSAIFSLPYHHKGFGFVGEAIIA
jgi:hypothetical protein